MKVVTIEKFLDVIEQEFKDLSNGKITVEGNFRDIIEWNSMNALLLMALISTEFDVNIGADELRSCNSVLDIYNVVFN